MNKQQTQPLGKVPPQAVEVERAVLGALMLEADAMRKVNGTLRKEMFYDSKHVTIFDSIQRLCNEGKSIDLLTISQALRDNNKLDDVGGPIYITQLTSNVASAAHIDYHIRIIIEKHVKRSIIRKTIELQQMSYEDIELDDLVSNWRNSWNDVMKTFSTGDTGMNHRDVMKKTIEEIEEDYAATMMNSSPGITTGFNKLDNALGGWRPGNMVILAARPGVGKTSVALHFAKMAAMEGKWVNFFSLEMKPTDLGRIMLSSECYNTSRSAIRDGRLDSENWKEIHSAVGQIEDFPMIWKDTAGMNINQITSAINRNKENGQCDLVIIDYIQLINAADKKVIREQQISQISREIKQTALAEDIPIIALSQLNRLAESEVPKPSHLRESGSLEQDADVILLPYKDNEDNYKIIIGKNRRGGRGYVDILPNDEMTRFEEDNEFPQTGDIEDLEPQF